MAFGNRKKNGQNAKKSEIGGNVAETDISRIFNALREEYNSIKREITFVATQNERIFLELSSQIKQLTAAPSGGHVAQGSPIPADVDELADSIALKLGAMKADDFDIVVDDYGCSAISDSIAQKLNYDVIASAITEKLHSELSYLIEKEPDYDEIASRVSQKIVEAVNSTERLPEIDTDDIADKVVFQLLDSAAKSQKATESRLDEIERQLAELKVMLSGIAVTHEIVADKVASGPAAIEVIRGDFEDSSDGVDFENMMKYDRSFIARIIQSTDEQKEYYGRVKTALMSYAKVNSNVAWGAERFSKGRETIARFKVRGKTLCLYLALNPQDFEYSVYHHQDVSYNKSMRGTPMMIKVKSPRGVKKAIRLIDDMLVRKNAVKRAKFTERNYAAMYPYESIEELIDEGLVKEVNKNK